MVTRKKLPKKKVVENIPRTRGEKQEARRLGSVCGYLKLRPGRPPNESQQKKNGRGKKSSSDDGNKASSQNKNEASSGNVASSGTTRKDPPSSTGMSPPRKFRGQRSRYFKWDDHPEILQEHIDARREKRTVMIRENVGGNEARLPPRSTINTYIKRLDVYEKETGKKLTVKEWIETMRRKQGRPTILPDKDRDRIQNIIIAREARNNPMSRRDVVEVISSITGCSTTQADNHYTYATSSDKFNLLLRGGRVCSAQKTTTSRTQVTVEQ